MSELVYLYAIVAGTPSVALAGIDRRPVRWVEESGLSGAVSSVAEEDFGEAGLNAGLANMNWLGPRAVAHQEVNQRLHEAANAVIPLSFGTVFRDEERVKRLLTDQHDQFATRLAAVKGRAEWVVAVHRVEAPEAAALQHASAALQTLHNEVAQAAPGRAHLLKQRLAQLERDELRRLDTETTAQIGRDLKSIADDVYVEPLPADAVERPLLRASVLVPRSADDQFMDFIDQAQERWQPLGYRILLTGPWPPYRFGGLATS